MELTRRYMFNGSAAAYGGRLVRPEDVVLASSGGSALSMAGGRSEWRDRDIRWGKSFRVARAETSATGLVDSIKDAIRYTHGKLPAEALTATTVVSARVRGLEVGGAPPLRRGDEPEPVMAVAEVSARLVSRSSSPGHESSVIIEEATISTVTFESPVHGRFKLDVVLDIAPFRRCDTRAKVVADPSIQQVHGDKDIVIATIVKDLVWQKDRAFPDARRLGTNAIYIPNLGRFAFGELFIQASSRRLLMISMGLGSPSGGDGVVGDVDTNGSWSF